MKYLFLAYGDKEPLDVMPSIEQEGFAQTCLLHEELLRKSGHLLAMEDLQDSSTQATVWIQNGEVALSDGSFAKTKGQIIKLFFINARDLNEALRLAANIPQMPGDSIEVWPLLEYH